MFRLSAAFIILILLSLMFQHCGQPLPPMGGPKDSLPPVLAKANPADSATNVKANRIILEFDEYIQLQDLQQQLTVSPAPKVQPILEARLKQLTIRIKDTLEDNTTYSINLGTALRDINESNIQRNFTYVFSTGSTIDSGKISGRILMAETGVADSTMVAVLHPQLSDTAILTIKPRYFTRLNKDGYFSFRYIKPGIYNVFALRDADGGLRYDQPSEAFGFLDQPVNLTTDTDPVKIYAFLREPEKPRRTTAGTGNAARPANAAGNNNRDDKRLRYTANLDGGSLDFRGDLQLKFERMPTRFDSSKIYLATDSGVRIPSRIILDSNIVSIRETWKPGGKYRLYIEKGLAEDSLGNQVLRNDTLKINVKKEDEYGSLAIRLIDLDTTVHPVLLFYQGEKLVKSDPLLTTRLTYRYMLPGDYDLKVLFDKNRNGKWDTGDYSKKLQPELIKPRKQKLSIRANWDNEIDINVKEVQNQD